LGGFVATRYLYVIQTNYASEIFVPPGHNWPKLGPLCLAKPVKFLIRRASVDPGRELNGRSQQLTMLM
jgi:hypothetical protein